MTYHVDHENDSASPGGMMLIEKDDRRWWPLVVSVGFSILSAILATVLCLTVSARNAERGREQRAILTQQATLQKETLCALIVSLDDNAQAIPPSTDLGKAQARTYASLRLSQGCPPRSSN